MSKTKSILIAFVCIVGVMIVIGFAVFPKLRKFMSKGGGGLTFYEDLALRYENLRDRIANNGDYLNDFEMWADSHRQTYMMDGICPELWKAVVSYFICMNHLFHDVDSITDEGDVDKCFKEIEDEIVRLLNDSDELEDCVHEVETFENGNDDIDENIQAVMKKYVEDINAFKNEEFGITLDDY